MVTTPYPPEPGRSDLEALWQERLEQRGRRRQAKQRKRRRDHRIVVDGELREQPSAERMSRALLAVRRQLDAATAERAARNANRGEPEAHS